MAPKTDRHQVAEVTRLAADGTPNACSMLLRAAAKSATAMGYARLQFFCEPGERTAPIFLKAAGFRFDGETLSPDWNHPRPGDKRKRRPSNQGPKHRWVADFKPVESVTPGRRKCHGCKRIIPISSRPDKKACSPACRQKAYRKRSKVKERIAKLDV